MENLEIEISVKDNNEAAMIAQADADKKRLEAQAAAHEARRAAKDAAEAKKTAEASTVVTGLFHELTTTIAAGRIYLIKSDSSETIALNLGVALDCLKRAKEFSKEIKVIVKPLKQPGDLTVAITAASDIIKGFEKEVSEFKKVLTAAKKAEKVAKRKEEDALREEARKAKALPRENGVTRPREGTTCSLAWDLMDSLSTKLEQPVPIRILLHAAEKHGLNPDTVKTQYARWKRFNGISGRVAIPIPDGIIE